jgi:hypothetical protein
MRPDWLRPEDIRRPITAQEAINAIEIAERSIERLRAIIERKEAEPNGEKTVVGLKALVLSWTGKRAEMTYFIERMAAGDSAEEAELAKKDEEIRRLKEENHKLQQRTISADGAADDLRRENKELKERNGKLVAKNEKLSQELTAAPPSPERVARMRKSHRDLAAFVAETLEGMAAEGVALNTMAQYLLKEANQSLPINYRKNWRLTDLPLKQALAQSLADLKEQMEQET